MITIQWINNCGIHWKEFYLVPVVQKVDSGIRWINLYLVDNAIGFPNTVVFIHQVVIYLVDSATQLLNNRGLLNETHYCSRLLKETEPLLFIMFVHC